MPPKSLLILIEGDTDKILFDKVIKPLLKRKYHPVSIRKYSELGKEGTNSIIKTFIKNGDDYIFITDIDKAKCISGKKQEMMREFSNIHDGHKIIVVKKEIESWYIAGLENNECKEFGFDPPSNTDKLGKGVFKEMRAKSGFKNDKAFMQEILRNFDIETAKQGNTSFKYFVDKYCL